MSARERRLWCHLGVYDYNNVDNSAPLFISKTKPNSKQDTTLVN